VGGYLNAFTSEEHTCIFARASHEHFAGLLDVMVDMFLNSRFAAADVEKERGIIRDELAMYVDQPHHYVQELLNEILWPDHPLGRPLTGTDRTIKSIRRADLMDFRRAHYVAGRTIITVAGRVCPEWVSRSIARFARGFPTAPPATFQVAKWSQERPVVKLVSRRSEQSHLALGIRTCSRHDERRYALRLLNVLLGENTSSRLFQVIREEHGLAYSIGAIPSFFADTGDLVISAGLETDNLRKTLRLIVQELRRLVNRPPGAAELRRAKDYAFGQMELGLESTENQMTWQGEHLLGYGRIFSPGEVRRRLQRVQPSDIRAVARDFFRPERLNLALVSPLKKDDGLDRLLAGCR
jgi:predicted Zn-dependent peptidase